MQELACRPSVVKNIVHRAAKVKRPIFIWGPPGIGKSEIVESIAQELGNTHLIDMRLALMEPTDLRGYPWRNPESNTMEWSPPVDLPTESFAAKHDHVILFMDELNSAPPSVQAAAYQLILNRRVGQYQLPDNVIIIAAGNRENDRGVTYRMPAPLANRFRHINMEVNFDDWQRWAIRKGVHRDVIGYLSYAKQDLFDFDPKRSGQAFATPRSWTYVSEMLDDPGFLNAQVSEQKAEIAGAVGEGMSGKFIEHRRLAGKMPNPSEVLAGTVKKINADMAKEISAKYSLTVGLAYEINELYKNINKNKVGDKAEFRKALNNVTRFGVDNFEPEMVILMFKTVLTDYGVRFNIREDLDSDLSKIFSDRYVQYILD
jgi:hypothetical protein